MKIAPGARLGNRLSPLTHGMIDNPPETVSASSSIATRPVTPISPHTQRCAATAGS